MNKNGTSDYYIKQVPMANGHPYFTIENKKTGKIDFTVGLDSCCFNAYNCTDVVYDVIGELERLESDMSILISAVKKLNFSDNNFSIYSDYLVQFNN